VRIILPGFDRFGGMMVRLGILMIVFFLFWPAAAESEPGSKGVTPV
jgi:hypothetical protein